MKVEYTCEVCGRRFNTQKEAEDCERFHNDKAAKREQLKKDSEAALSSLVEKHILTFKEIPKFTLSKEADDLAFDLFSDSFEHFLDKMLDVLSGGDKK